MANLKILKYILNSNLKNISSVLHILSPKDFLIICLSNILILTVPDEGYSRNASCALNWVSTIWLYHICLTHTCILIQINIILITTYLRWEVIVRFVDICGVVDHHFLNILFIIEPSYRILRPTQNNTC